MKDIRRKSKILRDCESCEIKTFFAEHKLLIILVKKNGEKRDNYNLVIIDQNRIFIF
jgi:hypothetical protein